MAPIQGGGGKAVHVMWSQAAAVLSGDFLFAAAADLVASLERPRIVRMFADTIMKMCRSEFDAPSFRAGSDGMLEDYLLKIEGKTASLFRSVLRGVSRACRRGRACPGCHAWLRHESGSRISNHG